MAKKQTEGTTEVEALGIVFTSLKAIDSPAQLRVLRHAAEMLGLTSDVVKATNRPINEHDESHPEDFDATTIITPETSSGDTEGISSVALKWMKRSDLSPKRLQSLFSLGIDEIDLVAKAVPGSSKKERMHNVLLLKGIAAYLGTGVARVTFEELKEACLHYDAYDVGNFATSLKSFVGDIGGTKESGFTLTARGLTSATELIRGILK